MRRPGLPHVTDILAAAGLIETTWFKQYDLDRGQALHKATQLLDERDLDWETVDPIILGRLRAYQLFLDEVEPEILSIEEAVVNEALRYQGKLDRRVRINCREGILDLKGPSRSAWNALQLSMYAACFPRPLVRWNLYLSEERYQLVEHKDRSDWEVCKAILTVVSWKDKNNGSH
jgi:hypothetical protein